MVSKIGCTVVSCSIDRDEKKILTRTCEARGQTSFAALNKSLALFSSCSVAGDKHVNGALDTSTHSAT